MEEFEWNVINEKHLFQAMITHKPVGVNKYFQMAFIWDKLTNSLNKEVHSEKIWSHLETMYNLEALDEGESLPFPNDEKDFYLPDTEYAQLKTKKDEKIEEKKNLQKGRETPKVMKEIKKEEKTPLKSVVSKEVQRRDSKDSREVKTPLPIKKEVKKESESKPKPIKSRNSVSNVKEESKSGKTKTEETPRAVKRPTRGSLKPEEVLNSGKSSPVNVTPGGTKRRRIL